MENKIDRVYTIRIRSLSPLIVSKTSFMWITIVMLLHRGTVYKYEIQV